MTWVELIPIAVGIAYTATAYGYVRQGQYGLALTYTCYALANVGLVIVAVENRGE